MRNPQSKKYRQKRRKKIAVISGLIFLVILACSTAIVLFLRFGSLQISEVQVKGNVAVDSAKVIELVESYLDTYVWQVIPQRSVFMYPAAPITAALYASIPRIDSVRLARHGDILTVEIHERVPSAVVCAHGGQPCFLVDETAFVYADAPEFSSRVYTEFDVAENAAALHLGTQFIPQKQFTNLKNLADDVSKIGLPITTIVFDSEEDMTFTAQSGTKIRVRSADSYDTVFNNLSLFLDRIDVQTKSKKSRSALQSIDLRFGSSVFYK